jgi:ASC-1-like (ASCH) protein
VIEDPQQRNKSEWIKNGLHSVEGRIRYPRIKAISCWDQNWIDNNNKTIDVRINSSAKPAEIYRTMINSSIFGSQPQFNIQRPIRLP